MSGAEQAGTPPLLCPSMGSKLVDWTSRRVSWIEFQYLVAEPHEIRHLREVHELGLFTEEEMLEALQAGGFQEVEFDPEGLTGRGLYLARPHSSD